MQINGGYYLLPSTHMALLNFTRLYKKEIISNGNFRHFFVSIEHYLIRHLFITRNELIDQTKQLQIKIRSC